MDLFIEVKGLRKCYGERVAVNNIDFSVRRGQTLGLLGPNGAGKSSTVAMLAGLLKVDGGTICFNGQAINPEQASYKQKLGLVPQELAIYDELTVKENLRLFGALYGLNKTQIAQRSSELLELVALTDRVNDFPHSFSGGMKRRLNIALALMHDPELVILDEPTVGIDPQSRNAIFEGLEALQRQGKTLIYTSHYMEEVERLADHILIIDHGKVIADDSPANLYQRLSVQAGLQLELLSEPDEDLLVRLQNVPGVVAISKPSQLSCLHLELQQQADAFAVLNLITELAIPVQHFASAKPSLEAIFLQLTGRNLRD